MRVRYQPGPLRSTDLLPDPLAQIARWVDDAAAAGLPEPNAVVLATVSAQGRPVARHVLLKEVDQRGLVFYTNHGSRKAQHLRDVPRASMCFPWFPMSRQLLVEGDVEAVADAVADAYWVSRPRESQLGAWASRQSEPIADRETLHRQLAAVAARFEGQPVPRPPFWGGYRLVPVEVECWQGQPGRLHDRLRYRRGPLGAWEVVRLQP